MPDLIPEVRREENEGINRITHRIGRLEAGENTRASTALQSSDDYASGSVLNTTNQSVAENQGDVPLSDDNSHASASSPSR